MAPDFESPFLRYASAVPENAPLFPRLSDHLAGMARFLEAIPEDKAGFAYAPGKWTVRQVVGHIWVSHRVFATRAIAIARGEEQALPGYDENRYAQGWPSAGVEMADLVEAYSAEARATQVWLLMLEDDELLREGTANGLRVRPEQILRALIGHETHHRAVLVERYGIAEAPPAEEEDPDAFDPNDPTEEEPA